MTTATGAPRVAVVTGGAAGIGAAIAEELARRGRFVVTVDPGVALDGSPDEDGAANITAQRIVDNGGLARASSVSVTDAGAVRALFEGLAAEFGALDTVVNVAGIVRVTGFATGNEDDWRAVLAVHLDGYLNVLRAALPLMASAGHGRILGVTSGSGWRAADAGAYACAKRAVAALTWQLGRVAPRGVTVNALSPIAATRMVTASRARRAGADDTEGARARGGVSLGSEVPPPEHLGPIGSHLASDGLPWCSGAVVFSNGSEVSIIAAPRLLEAASTADLATLPERLDAVIPALLAPAEVTQASSGGGNPRVGALARAHPSTTRRRCVVVSDIDAYGRALADALARRGVDCVRLGVGPGLAPGASDPAAAFEDAAARLRDAALEAGAIDAVVVAIAADSESLDAGTRDAAPWQRVLTEHTGIVDCIRVDAAWMRAVAEYATASDRFVRVITIVDATTAGGWSRGQAATQLTRAARLAASDRVEAFAISAEGATHASFEASAELAAHLACADDVNTLSGAEIAVGDGWIGLRSHPHPVGTVSFDGPAVPEWLDGAVRELLGQRTAGSLV